jgi:ATP-dependent DNA helicase DinG
MNNISRSIVDAIVQTLGPDGLLRRHHPRYEARPVQLAMAQRVAACLELDGKLVVEAGTGTGKTLAYLVPAVLSKKRVVISTATKTLQEQLYAKDIPFLLRLLGLDLPVVCVKGISNYLCLRRLHELRRQPELVPDPHLEEVLRWAEVTRTGDRTELVNLPDGLPLWNEISPTFETRLGPRCSFFEECFITRLRRQAAAARLLVVNHHLLLADLSLRAQRSEAGVLPPFDALILDEAHGVEAIATSFFGKSVSRGQLGVLGRDVRRAALLEGDAILEGLARRLEERSSELFFLLRRELPKLCGAPAADPEDPKGARLRLGQIVWVGELERPYFVLDAALEAISAHLEGRATAREEWQSLVRRGESLRQTLALFAEHPASGVIFWTEGQHENLSLHASPVEVGPLLRDTLLREPIPIVFTSATLASDTRESRSSETVDEERRSPSASSLAFFRHSVGLDEAEEAEELILPSPFDFARQALLYVPGDLPHPQRREFILRASERMSQLIDITAGRALVLFTSYRNLRAARELLIGHLDYPVLCQGDQPRALLLQRFREDVSSVLLATASFWEGVDVVGEALSLVIMDKLPFASPSDPLTAARIELMAERGDDPFLLYQLPQAALSLKQGFGRLIRHREDRGIVAVLDRRLSEMSYGRALLASLPPCPRTSDLLRVRAFAKEVLHITR